MKLPEHVDYIRSLSYNAFDKLFKRLGLGTSKSIDLEKLPEAAQARRKKLDELIQSHIEETGSFGMAREKALDELTFTLFNRIAAIKVMEAHRLFPEIITQRPENGDRSFAHKAWLERYPEKAAGKDLEGIRAFLKDEFDKLGDTIFLYHKDYPFALLPYVLDLKEVIDAFNAVEKDTDVGAEIWRSDDILGWLYESYNNFKKKAHKDSKAKTEYDKVSIQSQVYTPRWVVKFLVDNSLGKLYLEMYPDSEIKEKYAIANAPDTQVRAPKPLTEIRLIDPATGSGNFLLYAFDFFYDIYLDQIEDYGADYDEDKIPQLIIEHNLYGIDLDDRAVQLAQLGLYIKAKRKQPRLPIRRFNLVSSDFYLPEYKKVEHIFNNEDNPLNDDQQLLVQDIWGDLQQAHRFGSLVRVGEKVNQKLEELKARTEVNKKGLVDIFAYQDIVDFEIFKETFFAALETAITLYAEDHGENFLSNKTRDAITYLKLLTNQYDVATANPPYTDSASFGKELKKFIIDNYKKPYQFHTNLYATFIKRCHDLTHKDGKLALIHPLTFMYIKTFEGVRKFILDKMHISIFVDYGPDATNLFDGAFASAPAFYILEKELKINEESLFISLDQYTRTPKEKLKKELFISASTNFISKVSDKHNYIIQQSKLKEIQSFPFIYWISDGFRKKFSSIDIDKVASVKSGLATANNDRFLRYWWEVLPDTISKNYSLDNRKWVVYAKGGSFNRWYGNLWLIVNWEKNGEEMKKTGRAVFRNKEYYFQKGITYSATSTNGSSFRLLPENCIYDVKGASLFLDGSANFHFMLSLLNSKLSTYIIKCLNHTVETQVGDIKRIPFVSPTEKQLSLIRPIVNNLISIKEYLAKESILEKSFLKSPIDTQDFQGDVKQKIIYFLNNENHLVSTILIGEAYLNQLIFNIYTLSPDDELMVLNEEGKSIGALPISSQAKQAFLNEETNNSFLLNHIKSYIKTLPEKAFLNEEKLIIEQGFPTLYQKNNNLEKFCIRHQVNPINVWYWFKESSVIPQQRMNDLAMEFLADMIRELLEEDEDGIIPLVPNAGEEILLHRIEKKFIEKGFSMAQYTSFNKVLGRELNDYLNHHFFKHLSDHLNLFMYLPKTPFIWHLSSGPHQGFDCYLIIYKWSRDRLLSLKSIYLENRERALLNRQSDLAGDDSPKAIDETETIRHQLRELKVFKEKIDALLAEGYNPILDDGVGKNIAPLQAKGMLAYEVLNKGQLKKYLNADW